MAEIVGSLSGVERSSCSGLVRRRGQALAHLMDPEDERLWLQGVQLDDAGGGAARPMPHSIMVDHILYGSLLELAVFYLFLVMDLRHHHCPFAFGLLMIHGLFHFFEFLPQSLSLMGLLLGTLGVDIDLNGALAFFIDDLVLFLIFPIIILSYGLSLDALLAFVGDGSLVLDALGLLVLVPWETGP